MSVLIKGMKMPEKCGNCPISTNTRRCVILWQEFNPKKRLDNCPLIELPPHGRLIDADALLKPKNQHVDVLADEWYVMVRTIETAPTILEAEVEE